MSAYSVHGSAIVETREIGDATRIWAFTHILPGARIGGDCNICDHCYIENKVVIGARVTVKCGVYLWDGIKVEDDVFIGPAAVFTNDLYPRSGNRGYEQKTTVLKKGCSIGANATVLCGLTVGRYAMVGAGAVVTKDIPDFTLFYGNPAVFHGFRCVCARELAFKDDKARCACGRAYTRRGSRVSVRRV